MAENVGILFQIQPGAGGLADAYTVPAGKQAVISTLWVANCGNTSTTFEVALAPGAAAPTNAHIIFPNVPIGVSNTFAATQGITIAAGDVVRVKSASGQVSFTACGSVRDI